jgi:hypothetical protein
MLLSAAKEEAKAVRLRIPLGMVALRSDEKQFFVESRDGFRDYVKADCAWHAKALVVQELIDKATSKS